MSFLRRRFLFVDRPSWLRALNFVAKVRNTQGRVRSTNGLLPELCCVGLIAGFRAVQSSLCQERRNCRGVCFVRRSHVVLGALGDRVGSVFTKTPPKLPQEQAEEVDWKDSTTNDLSTLTPRHNRIAATVGSIRLEVALRRRRPAIVVTITFDSPIREPQSSRFCSSVSLCDSFKSSLL